MASAKRERLLDEYTVGDVLGDGAFGVVYACKKRATGEDFAVKMVDKVETPVQLIKKEADMLQAMNHRNVVKFHKVVYEKCFVCIVMDLFRGGDIVDGMQLHHANKGKILPHAIVHIARQMTESIAYLHSLSVVHRDVKGDNYLLDRKDISDIDCHVVLSDFGTARQLKEGEKMSEECGTKLFWAPEVYNKEYGPKADVWAIGVIMYGLLDGRFPFKGESDIRRKVVVLPKTTGPDCENWVLSMIEKEEAKRLSAQECMAHRWIAGSAPAPAAQPQEQKKAEEPARRDPDGVKHDRAEGAIKERRAELVERLQDNHKDRGERGGGAAGGGAAAPAPVPTSKHFWKPSFTILDRHAGNVAFKFEWWSPARSDEAGINDMAGAHIVQEAAQAQPPPSDVVGKMLLDHGIDVAPFGQGKAKTLDQLAAEVQRGASRLLLDAAEHKKLVRVVDVVLLRICSTDGSEQSPKAGEQVRFLIEMSEQFSDGRSRDVTRMPGTKKEPEENTKMTARRILRDMLNMSDCKMLFDLKSKEVFEQEEDSPSFPGMRTVYRKEVVECYVSTTDAAVLQRVGLPGGSGWNFRDAGGNQKTFAWLSEEQCTGAGVQLRIDDDADDASGLVQAPIGLNEADLRRYLEAASVDITRFGQDHTKTIKEFSAELMKGESTILRDAEGKVTRVADVVLVKIVNDKGEQLVQSEKTFPDGHKQALNRLPGTKRRPDENQFLTAWRIIRKQMKIDENFVNLRPESVVIVEETKDSPQYPGIQTVYRKRVITAELLTEDQAAQARRSKEQRLEAKREAS